ncbi:hypothetical protein CONCODRAFT_11942 [Conidiobolus coronatus NRRL 28638]|uniref:Uncharacterized protein n=1 Tax=Conidiobolus coronatus (strain ATCC 28846 / CBS 209.66 / NRRL 28638) TaxID=796925 RepID=A0A137NU45_CONC2|nr:hypothetical protein CONCODRAFT_11942 [Conidiobolus coronatus NRRL 28638]|eukprot:KXN66256.1 hypothetical protein CONCODRAFT_11942 [Conidiobolus coronatus NRRL 28638]
MDHNNKLAYIGSISLITILIADFIVIELVLKLGVFSLGNKWARVLLLLFLFLQTLIVCLYDLTLNSNYNYLAVVPVVWIIWNNLYFYMLIEQNDYWMSATTKKRLFITWIAFNLIAIPSGTIAVCVYTYSIPFGDLFYANLTDFIVLIYLCIVEKYLVVKVYFFSKTKLKSVSSELWAKVKFSILVCGICVIIDILNAVLEVSGFVHYAYLFKPCVFAFKVIFECMCFQFIKGIVFSINQTT